MPALTAIESRRSRDLLLRPHVACEAQARRWIAIPLIAFLLSGVVGCSGGSDSGAPQTQSTQTVQPTREVAEALPVLSITVNSGAEITSKETYEAARYRLTSETGHVLLDSTLEIRGRGNSTWEMPKKPYRLRLTSSTAILGMPANRHWVLLANYSDKTLIRNAVAFDLSRRVGMEYTPRNVQVELHLNGTYRGVYQLAEQIRIGPDRVNIPELDVDDTTPDLITGGYLIEIDFRKGEDYCYESPRTAIDFCFSNPETLLEPGWEPHRAYIDGYLAQTEAAMFSDQFADPVAGYAAYLDVDSAINFFLITEWLKNVDSNLVASVYLQKKRNGKLTFGPVWDFDLSIGNVDFLSDTGLDAGSPEDWYVRYASWFARMFQDPAFEAKVKVRWGQLKASGVLEDTFTYIDKQSRWLSKVQVKNYQLWDTLGTYVWPNRVVTGSYEGEVAAMKAWLRARTNWMDAQLSQ